ncbi:hypothetical protein [Halorhabdus amylolytica]|uniref:hypothetical protein n=1 Tax=Halorhabdus amylolytica TaxID=2559573 RepID=UPI00145B93AD|nr:hypothetical protein [Halorhabdus amylolytica]
MRDDKTTEPAEAEIEGRPSFEGQIFSGRKGQVEEKLSENISQADESDESTSRTE